MNNNQGKRIGVGYYSVVNKLPLLNYLTNVINTFDKRNYRLVRINIIEIKLIDKFITPCFLLIDVDNKTIIKEGEILSKSQLRELYCRYKDSMGVIILDSTKSENIKLLDETLNVNLNKNILSLFPYLKEVIYDLVNHNYENNPTNYHQLTQNIKSKYTNEINERQTFLTIQKKEQEQKEKTTTEELSKLLSYIDTLNLDEVTKEALKSRIKIKI